MDAVDNGKPKLKRVRKSAESRSQMPAILEADKESDLPQVEDPEPAPKTRVGGLHDLDADRGRRTTSASLLCDLRVSAIGVWS